MPLGAEHVHDALEARRERPAQSLLASRGGSLGARRRKNLTALATSRSWRAATPLHRPRGRSRRCSSRWTAASPAAPGPPRAMRHVAELGGGRPGLLQGLRPVEEWRRTSGSGCRCCACSPLIGAISFRPHHHQAEEARSSRAACRSTRRATGGGRPRPRRVPRPRSSRPGDLRRPVAVSTMRCPSRWRTTSRRSRRTKAMSSTLQHVDRLPSTDFWAVGKSTWVTSPVTATRDRSRAGQEHQHLLAASCSAPCPVEKLSFSVRPRMKRAARPRCVPARVCLDFPQRASCREGHRATDAGRAATFSAYRRAESRGLPASTAGRVRMIRETAPSHNRGQPAPWQDRSCPCRRGRCRR